MKLILKLEEAAMFGASIYAFSFLPYAWWWYPVMILAPDVSIAGYAAGPRVGAVIYNLFHHKGIALAIWAAGIVTENHVLAFAGIILFGHSSMDRLSGYGLKYPDDFKNTHLGRIGKG